MLRLLLDNLTDERIKSSLLKPFYTTWVIINWNFLVILIFSNEQIMARICLASKQIDLWSAAGKPLLYTLAYILIYPWLTYGVSWIQRLPKRLQREGEINLENNLNKLKSTSLDEKEEIIEKEEKLRIKQIELDKRKPKSRKPLDETAKNILLTLYNLENEGREEFGSIEDLERGGINISRAELKYYLNGPLLDYVDKEVLSNEDVYTLNQKGRAYILNDQLDARILKVSKNNIEIDDLPPLP